jgi:hypothetical protein
VTIKLIALPLVLLAAAFSAGCGSGDSATDQAPISKAEFIKKASSACAKTSGKIESEFSSYVQGQAGREVEKAEKAKEMTPDEAAAKVTEVILIPAKNQEVGEIRALGSPRGDENRIRELLDTFEEGIEKAEAHPERAAIDGDEAFGTASHMADQYGLEGC